MVFYTSDTIAAISTPFGFGGIGVVRISGPDSQKITREIFRPSDRNTSQNKEASLKSAPHIFAPRKMVRGHIAAPGQNEVLDEVLMVFMPAPHSYTREDVIEIQAHSGPVVIKAILDLILEQGARLAEAGEFTRRAYLNGRLDLSQAEAVIDVINAKTEASLKIASRQLEGDLGRWVHGIRERLLEVHAVLEAEIEFPEETEETEAGVDICRSSLGTVLSELDEILDGYKKGHLLRDGLRLIIIGKVNVGKSSLLNRFLRKERAIVTEIPGTTRDHIEETLDLFGLPVILTDTAGWRETKDPVEAIGIHRTRDLADAADLILFMVDAEKGVLPEDRAIYQRIQDKEKILVINKTDLLQGSETLSIPEDWEFFDTIYTSVKYDRGVETLKRRIRSFGTEGWVGQENSIVPNLRQKRLFEKARSAIRAAQAGTEQKSHSELMVMDLKEAMAALDEITGDTVKTDVMDMVFSRFCIGK